MCALFSAKNLHNHIPALRFILRGVIPALSIAGPVLPGDALAQFNFPALQPALQEVPQTGAKTFGDQMHAGASDLLNDFASELDSFFAADVSGDSVNPTRATVRLDFSNPPDQAFSTSVKLKLRLVLPRSEQRFRVLLDVDDDDDDDPNVDDDDPNAPVENAAPGDTDEAVSLALRFIRNATDNTRFNVDVGARRFDSRFQAFARLRVSNRRLNEEGWSFSLKNDLRFYAVSGYTNRTTFDFWHTLNFNESAIFRSSSSINWENIQDGARIDQTVGYYNQLKQNSLLAVEMLAGYSTSPEEGMSHYDGHTLRVRYRKNIFRPWFHYELWPAVSWLTEGEGGAVFSGLVRTEIQFGRVQKY